MQWNHRMGPIPYIWGVTEAMKIPSHGGDFCDRRAHQGGTLAGLQVSEALPSMPTSTTGESHE
jgi:hypothetical protein